MMQVLKLSQQHNSAQEHFTEKSFVDETGISLGHVRKGHINPSDISWPHVSYSINSLAMKTPGNTEYDHDDTEAADERDIQME